MVYDLEPAVLDGRRCESVKFHKWAVNYWWV